MKMFIPNKNGAHFTLSVGVTAQTLAQLGAALDVGTEGIVIQTESGDVRYSVNTTTPTASIGLLCREFDQPLPLTRQEADSLKLISSSDSTITVQLAQYSQIP